MNRKRLIQWACDELTGKVEDAVHSKKITRPQAIYIYAIIGRVSRMTDLLPQQISDDAWDGAYVYLPFKKPYIPGPKPPQLKMPTYKRSLGVFLKGSTRR